jgi:hypothetical protein
VDERTVQFPHTDLYEVLSLTVNGEEQVASSSGQLMPGSSLPRGPFGSWDAWNGRVTLLRGVEGGSLVRATYRYREHLYVYEGYSDAGNVFHELNLNPTSGHMYDGTRPTRELLKKTVYLYLLPTAAYRVIRADGTYEQDRKIYTGNRWVKDGRPWTPATTSSMTEEGT